MASETKCDVLSQRGQGVIMPIVPYMGKVFQSLADLYSNENPEGFLCMTVAENKLTSGALAKDLGAAVAMPEHAMGYNDMTGHPAFRSAMAGMMTRTLLPAGADPIDPSTLVITNGCGSALDHLFYVTCEPGDGVVIPTPYYPAFDADLRVRARCTILRARLETPGGRPTITAAALDEAAAAGREAGARVRSLLITNPTNPHGIVHTAAELETALVWCAAQDPPVQLVVDEVYGNGRLPRRRASAAAGTAGEAAAAATPLGEEEGQVAPMKSAITLRRERAREGLPCPPVHVLYGLSKDFAGSGLRVGVVQTESQQLRSALGALSAFSAVSFPAQFRFAQLLGDPEWTSAALKRNVAAVAAQRDLTCAAFERLGVEFLEPEAGLFMWIDLRPQVSAWLARQASGGAPGGADGSLTWENEAAFHDALFEQAKVLLTPGHSCHADEPGFFRVVYAYVPASGIAAMEERLGAFFAQE